MTRRSLTEDVSSGDKDGQFSYCVRALKGEASLVKLVVETNVTNALTLGTSVLARW